MSRPLLSRRVEAPLAEVFALFADLERAPGRIPSIRRIEMLTPGPLGVGSRFRETRVVFGREATEEMEISGFDPGRSYEVKCSTGGCDCFTSFHFRPDGSDATIVDVHLRMQRRSLIAMLLAPLRWLMRRMMRKCLVEDLDGLQSVAENACRSVG